MYPYIEPDENKKTIKTLWNENRILVDLLDHQKDKTFVYSCAFFGIGVIVGLVISSVV